jgi:hypothetical protein
MRHIEHYQQVDKLYESAAKRKRAAQQKKKADELAAQPHPALKAAAKNLRA